MSCEQPELEINIVDAINRQLYIDAVNAFESKQRDYTYFHPSEFDVCHRQMAYHYYHAKGFISVDSASLKNVIDPIGQRIFDNGHSMHARWRKYLDRSGALRGVWESKDKKKYGIGEKLGVLKPNDQCVYHEISLFDDETWWGGHLDAILDMDIWRAYQLRLATKGHSDKVDAPAKTNRLLLIDFKSINPRQFNDLTGPLPKHVTQMQIYLYLTGLQYGRFIYEDKWTQSTKEFLVIRDDNLLAIKKDEALRLKFILNHTDSQGRRVLPQRHYKERTNKECLRCKFRGHCWK